MRRLIQPVGFLIAAALIVAGWYDAGFVLAIVAGALVLTLWTYAMGFERLVQWELRKGALRFVLVTLVFLAGHALIAALLYGLGVFAAWLIS